MSNNIQIIILVLAILYIFRYLWQNSDDVFFGNQGLMLGRAMIALLVFLLFILGAKINVEEKKYDLLQNKERIKAILKAIFKQKNEKRES